MKNFKDLLKVLFLGILFAGLGNCLAGCDGVGAPIEDAGSEAITRADALPPADSRVVSCSIPVATAPEGAVSYVVTTTDVSALCFEKLTSGSLRYQGLACSPEVDWGVHGASYCLFISEGADGYVVGDFMGKKVVRRTAVCSTSGMFVGWSCS